MEILDTEYYVILTSTMILWQLGYGIGNMADLVSGARVPGVSLSNDLRKLGQIVQRLYRVRFRHVPYFRGYVTDTWFSRVQ